MQRWELVTIFDDHKHVFLIILITQLSALTAGNKPHIYTFINCSGINLPRQWQWVRVRIRSEGPNPCDHEPDIHFPYVHNYPVILEIAE